MFKRLMSALLVLVMVLSIMPMNAFAEEAEVPEPPVVEEQPVSTEATEEATEAATEESPLTDATEAAPEETLTSEEATEAPEEETAAPTEEETVAPAEAEEAELMAIADTDVAKIGETGYATLAEAFTAAVDGDTIYLLADVTQEAAITLSSARNLTLAVEEGKSFTISKSKGAMVLFDVKKGSLTLNGGLTLKGDMAGGTSTKSLVTVQGGATLTMNDGVTLRDNTANAAASTAASHAAGAVYMYGNSTFIMNGGSIINCHNASNANTSSYSYAGGGAVRMFGSRSTTVKFIMNGGVISGCSANFGGAVGMSTNGATLVSFEMNGGTISGCSSTKKYGSAVAIYGDNTDKNIFTMNGGTITGNDCYQYGALSSVSTTATKAGRFYLLGGTISGNTRVSNSGFNNGTPGSEHGGHNANNGSFIIGGTAQVLDEIGLSGKTVTIRDDFTGTAYFYTYVDRKVTGYGTVIGLPTGTASSEIAGRIVMTNAVYGEDGNYIRDPEGKLVPRFSVVVENNNYVLGEYVEPVTEYTVTYTDGVADAEVFADQVFTVKEGEATPTFEAPKYPGFVFAGWTPEVAETVTADATYTATWTECTHVWDEGVTDPETNVTTYTCTLCGETRTVSIVARVESTGETYESLQAALNAARDLINNADGDHAAQTVTLLANTTENVSVTFVKGLKVAYDFNLTIDLNGHTVTGLGTDSVMKFSESGSGAAKYHMYITINDSVGGCITGGNATSGGAIKMTGKSGTTLTINGGTFSGNTASSTGGAIYSSVVGMDIIINGGTFSNNTAGNGGAISAVDLTINGGTFTDNVANGTAQYTGRGGAICVYGTGVVEMTINGGNFSGNTASRYGDDVLFGTTKKATVKLCDPTVIGTGYNAWAVDGYNGAVSGEANLTDRYSAENAVAFENYANYSATGNMVALKLAFITTNYTVTYTDGVEDEEVFADVTYTVEEGEATPAFGKDPLRVGYEFLGWEPTVAETVTADVTYVAQWKEAEGLAYIFVVGPNGEAINYTHREGGVGKIEHLSTDSYFYAYTSTYEGNSFGSFKAGVYYDITAVPADTFVGWFIGDECISTDAVLTQRFLRTLPKLTDKSVVVEARYLSATDPRTITYTDGVETAVIFEDQVYTALPGEETPAFDGTPTRPGCTFLGWSPEWSATVTNNVTYVAQWDGVPPMPEKYCGNIENFETFVTVTCDTDHERHPDLACKIYGNNNFEVKSAEPEWNEELGAWTVNATVSKFSVFYSDAMWDTYKVFHDVVGELSQNVVLKWDADKNLWVATEDVVVHTSCRTVPMAPSYRQVHYQITVHGMVGGEEKEYTTTIPEDGYTLSEVTGSRETGFYVTVTAPLADGDIYQTTWIEKRNPGFYYHYDWEKTPETVTFVLRYNGKLNETLYGDRHAGNTNYDWVLDSNGNHFGVVGDAYLAQDTYTVTFNPNGCPGTYEPITVIYGEAYGTLPVAEKVNGIRNDGWYLVDETGAPIGKEIKKSTVVTTVGDHVLFQKRAIIPPNVKITLKNDGEMGDTYKYYNGATRTLTVEFTGNLNEEILNYSYQWYKDNVAIEGATEKVLVLDGNVSDTGTYKCAVTATLKDGVDIVVIEPSATREASVKVTIMRLANTYTYDFNGNGQESTSSYTNGTSFTVTTTVPTRTGYTFAGWNTAADGTGDAYAAGDTCTFEGDKGNGGEKITLYAQWTANTYTLTLDPNGGEFATRGLNEDGTYALTVTYGKAIGEMPVPTKTGYTFAGWVDAEGNVVTAETVYNVAGDSTVTAQWTVNTYTITLNPGSGSLKDKTVEVTYGEAVGKLPTPSRDGYYFSGWVDEDGNKYTEDTIYNVAGDITLKALWWRAGDPSSPATGDGMTMFFMTTMLISAGALLFFLNRKRRIA